MAVLTQNDALLRFPPQRLYRGAVRGELRRLCAFLLTAEVMKVEAPSVIFVATNAGLKTFDVHQRPSSLAFSLAILLRVLRLVLSTVLL